MEEFFSSFWYRLAVWTLLAASAVGLWILYEILRRKEQRLQAAESLQELQEQIKRETLRCEHLQESFQDLQLCKAEHEKMQQEVHKARQWLDSKEMQLNEIKELKRQVEQLHVQHSQFQQSASLLPDLQSEKQKLHEQLKVLDEEHEKKTVDLKTASDVYLALNKEIEERRNQLAAVKKTQSNLTQQLQKHQEELKRATEEYLRVSEDVDRRKDQLQEARKEIEQLQRRKERLKVENPFLADHQEHLARQWRNLEGQYEDVVMRNRREWEKLEEQFERLREQAKRASSSLSL